VPVGRPEYLRQQVELNLRHLGLERLDLLQLHRVDPKVPLEDQIGELAALQGEGKIRHIGLSEVPVEHVEAARRIAPIVSVQNRYNLADRAAGDVLEHCEREGIAFIPWFPLATGRLAGEGSPVARIAADKGVSPSQIALAWLLHRSPVILPIPGTSSVAHLEDNVAAAGVELTGGEMTALNAATG
jgi:aryl-alcohol dehydrogenase-like predicted oxidoreductase